MNNTQDSRKRAWLHTEVVDVNQMRYTRWIPNNHGTDRLVRTNVYLGRFAVDGAASRKPMSFWAINDVVVNTALAEIVDGCDPLDCARLQEAVDGQLKERCGTRIVCLSIEWVQSALAHCARMRAYEKGDAVEWSMLFWDAAQAANLIARHILPALAPHALLLDSFELDMRDYAYARRMHGMSGLGFRDIQSDPLTGCGLLEIGMTLYTGRPYERRTTAKVPINYY